MLEPHYTVFYSQETIRTYCFHVTLHAKLDLLTSYISAVICSKKFKVNQKLFLLFKWVLHYLTVCGWEQPEKHTDFCSPICKTLVFYTVVVSEIPNHRCEFIQRGFNNLDDALPILSLHFRFVDLQKGFCFTFIYVKQSSVWIAILFPEKHM